MYTISQKEHHQPQMHLIAINCTWLSAACQPKLWIGKNMMLSDEVVLRVW
jgi:hypothetical protein